MTAYYSLLERDNAGTPWAIAFGDYDIDVVNDEAQSYCDDGYTNANLKVITTLPAQASIDSKLNELNLKYCVSTKGGLTQMTSNQVSEPEQKIYTLLQRENIDTPWSTIFADVDLKCVNEQANYLVDQEGWHPSLNLKTVVSDNNAAAIDAAIAIANNVNQVSEPSAPVADGVKNETAKEYKINAKSKGDDIIKAALQILQARVTREKSLTSSSDTRDFLTVRAAGLQHEVFSILFLDNQHGIIAIEDMFRGTIDGAAVYPREVIKAALEHNAAAVILTHNHPSGAVEPSQSDKAITNKIKNALNAIDVRVLDHVITAGGKTTSFAERGLMS